jgi:hypothetical protein
MIIANNIYNADEKAFLISVEFTIKRIFDTTVVASP